MNADSVVTTRDDGDHSREHLWQIVRGTRFAMVTTIGEGDALRSRPLTTQNHRHDIGDKLFFFVPAAGEVADDLHHDPRVGVVYADTDKDRYVSISGVARVVHDLRRQAELWSPLAQGWFPGGPDDPGLRLLEVQMESAKYWDVKASKMTQLLRMAKAAVVRRPPTDIGEHRDVPVR